MPKIADATKELEEFFSNSFQRNWLDTVTAKNDSHTLAGINKSFIKRLAQESYATLHDPAVLIIDNRHHLSRKSGEFIKIIDFQKGIYQQRRCSALDEVYQRVVLSLQTYFLLGKPCRIYFSNEAKGNQDDIVFDGVSEDSFLQVLSILRKMRSRDQRARVPQPLYSRVYYKLPNNKDYKPTDILNIISTCNINRPEGEYVDSDWYLQMANSIVRYCKDKNIRVVLNLVADGKGETKAQYLRQFSEQRIHHTGESYYYKKIPFDIVQTIWAELQSCKRHNPTIAQPLMLYMLRQSGMLIHTTGPYQPFNSLSLETLNDHDKLNMVMTILNIQDISVGEQFHRVLASIPLVYQPRRHISITKQVYYPDERKAIEQPLMRESDIAAAFSKQLGYYQWSQFILERTRTLFRRFLPTQQQFTVDVKPFADTDVFLTTRLDENWQHKRRRAILDETQIDVLHRAKKRAKITDDQDKEKSLGQQPMYYPKLNTNSNITASAPPFELNEQEGIIDDRCRVQRVTTTVHDMGLFPREVTESPAQQLISPLYTVKREMGDFQLSGALQFKEQTRPESDLKLVSALSQENLTVTPWSIPENKSVEEPVESSNEATSSGSNTGKKNERQLSYCY